MKYREQERERLVAIREEIFEDRGGGLYRNIQRPFILQKSNKNLMPQIKEGAIEYFKKNAIVWWPGSAEPTGHLLSSQVACVNHLFFLRNDEFAALKILKGIDKDFVKVCADFEGGYVGFEVVSKGSYLNEVTQGKAQTRGANCTSIDAMMCGVKEDGTKVQVLIEWKYTEFYPKNCMASGSSGETRKGRYNSLIKAPESPFIDGLDLDNLYYEPFYQIMRQTLLAWQMTKNKERELNADDWLLVDVIPENNKYLRERVHAPDLPDGDMHKAWEMVLKEPQKYRMMTPMDLLRPLNNEKNYEEVLNYLNKRYS